LHRLERLELAGLDQDVAVLGDLVALDDVLVGDLLAVLGVHALVLDPRAGLARELVKPHALAIERAVQLHGHGDHAEADSSGPHRAGHAPVVPPPRPSTYRCKWVAAARSRRRAPVQSSPAG